MTTFDAATLLPVLAPAIGALLVLVVDIIVPRAFGVHYAIAFISLVVGVFGTTDALSAGPGDVRQTLCLPAGGTCFYTVSGLTAALQLATLVATGITLLLAWPLEPRGDRDRTAVTLSLLLAATSGAVGVAAARDLGSWLVTLELATLPVVALAALTGTRRALAGAIQLLTTSIVSFAVLTLAAACWYAATGSPSLTSAAALAATSTPQRGLLALSVVLVLAGIGFKLSLVPFHAWTPTAYAGAPLPIAAFLAGVSKVAALGALLVVITAVASLGKAALIGTAVLAVASMTLGNLVALRQDDVVRLLAWSTVAQAGWVVLPLISVSSLGARSSAAYLLTYLVATLVVFTAVAVTIRGSRGRSGRRLTAYRGLVRSHPFVGGALALGLLSLAGLPPGVLGLIGKVVALRPVVIEGWWVIAVIAAVNAVLGAAVYLRWLRVMLEPAPGPAAPAAAAAPVAPVVTAHLSHRVALSIGVLVLITLSVQPQILLGLLT
ncbi:proton-conducting transporter membrane subunit [Lapillicoccus sp.]|uniref:NADH-quinone oxidoreductase subunit N n=1 Tax=Lapillicoccus sp. TaxID=1909287 RepID=UPI0025D49459|nr:proton-conducting transporter membrane subunit [Lapillicoccus sp.]